MKKLAVAILSVVVCFDVGGVVSEYHTSANTPDYTSRTECVINPTTGVPNTDQKYWKRSSDDVVEMSAGEKSTVDSADQTTRDARTTLVNSVKSKIQTLGFTTDETDVILGGSG